MSKSDVESRMTSAAKSADDKQKGKPFYPLNHCKGGESSFYVVSDPKSPFLFIDVVTVEEARERYGLRV